MGADHAFRHEVPLSYAGTNRIRYQGRLLSALSASCEAPLAVGKVWRSDILLLYSTKYTRSIAKL